MFLRHDDFEEKWVLNYTGRPIWFRFVDDIFTLFGSKNNALQFLQYLNSCHVNIKFTIEFEENNVIPFLDVLTKRHNHTIAISIYRKKTFTGLYTKFGFVNSSKIQSKLKSDPAYPHFSLFPHLLGLVCYNRLWMSLRSCCHKTITP